ncbi:MAG: hypothetical protein ABII02_02155 [Candidatus Magasanikbacteria bacterium]
MKKQTIKYLIILSLTILFVVVGLITDRYVLLRDLFYWKIGNLFIFPGGIFLCAVLLFGIYYFFSGIRQKMFTKPFFWALSCYTFGFFCFQLVASILYNEVFIHLTIEGYMSGNIVGIVVNPFNYIFSLPAAFFGLIVDGIIWVKVRRNKSTRIS